MIESILKNELYMGYIFGIMILGGFIREHSALEDVYSLAKKYVKDNRVLVIITSLLGGILPIPGRVALSAPLLDAIAPPDKERRSAFGVIDYLSVHHYYWWSPLEKTVVLPMAVMGVSYSTFLGYTIIPLAITLAYTWWYIFTKVPAASVVPNLEYVRDFNWRRAITGWAPLIATVILLLNTGKAGAPFFFPMVPCNVNLLFDCLPWIGNGVDGWMVSLLSLQLLSLLLVVSSDRSKNL